MEPIYLDELAVPTSHFGSLGLIASKFMWALWWLKWHRASSQFRFSLPIFILQYAHFSCLLSTAVTMGHLQHNTDAYSVILSKKTLHEAQIQLNFLYKMADYREISIRNIHTRKSTKLMVYFSKSYVVNKMQTKISPRLG
jgi:hypothetical protein